MENYVHIHHTLIFKPPGNFFLSLWNKIAENKFHVRINKSGQNRAKQQKTKPDWNLKRFCIVLETPAKLSEPKIVLKYSFLRPNEGPWLWASGSQSLLWDLKVLGSITAFFEPYFKSIRRSLICLVNAHSEKKWKRTRIIKLGFLKNGLNQEKKSWDEKVQMNDCDNL